MNKLDGATSRMLACAKLAASNGKSVLVLAATASHAADLRRLLADAPGIEVRCVAQGPPRGSRKTCFVDHYAWQYMQESAPLDFNEWSSLVREQDKEAPHA